MTRKFEIIFGIVLVVLALVCFIVSPPPDFRVILGMASVFIGIYFLNPKRKEKEDNEYKYEYDEYIDGIEEDEEYIYIIVKMPKQFSNKDEDDNDDLD